MSTSEEYPYFVEIRTGKVAKRDTYGEGQVRLHFIYRHEPTEKDILQCLNTFWRGRIEGTQLTTIPADE